MISLKHLFFLSVSLTVINAFATSPHWSLSDCMAQAKKASLKLQSVKLSEEKATVSLKQAKNERYPNLSASINQSLYDSPFKSGPQDHYRLNLGLSSSMKLWDGGATTLTIENRLLRKQSIFFQIEQTWLEIQESVLNSYISLLAAEGNVQIARAAFLLAEEDLKHIQYLFEAGSLTQKDLVLAKSEHAQKKAAVLLAEQTVENGRTSLRQLIEIPRESELKIEAPEFNITNPNEMPPLPTLADLFTDIQKNYPGLLADSIDILASQKEEAIASKTNSINVSLGASASTGLNAWESSAYGNQVKDGYSHNLSLGINIPLIDNGATTTNVLQAQISVTQARLNKRDTEKSLENAIELLYLNAESADLQWEAAILQKEAAEEVLRVAEEHRTYGIMAYTDFLEQKNKFEVAELNLNKAKYNSLLMRKRIDLYRGFFKS